MSRHSAEKDIVVLGFTGIGNMLMFAFTLHYIRMQFPDKKIVLYSYNQDLSRFLVTMGFIDEYILFADPFKPTNRYQAHFRRLKNLIRILFSKHSYHSLYMPFMQTNKHLALVCLFIKAEKKYLHHSPAINSFKAFFDKLTPVVTNAHDVKQNENLWSYDHRQNIFHDYDQVRNKVLGIVSRKKDIDKDINDYLNKKIIVVHPVGKLTYNSSRQIDVSVFADVIGKLSDHFSDVHIIVLGSKKDRDAVFQISFNSRVHFMVDKKFEDLLLLINRSLFFLGIDSSIGHLASLTKTNIFTIYGPTNPNEIRPFSERHKAILLGLSCQPCFSTGFSSICKHKSCLLLDSNDIFRFIVSNLQSNDELALLSK